MRIKIENPGDFSGGPVFTTLHFHSKGVDSVPGQESKIPTCQAVWYDQEIKQTKDPPGKSTHPAPCKQSINTAMV